MSAAWPIVAFGEIVENCNARRVPVKSADREKRAGAYPYYGASGIIDTIDDYLFDGEHLLIGEDGANLLARSTPIAFRAQGKFWVNNHAHIVRFNGKAELRFLEHFFTTLDLAPYVTGSAQPKLTRENLDRIPVPLPHLPEQRRIADILDKADAICRKRKQAITLTEDLLRSAFLEMFGDPVTNPKGWRIDSLANVVQEGTIVTYGIVQAGPHVEDGVPYIRTGDIQNGRILGAQLLRAAPEIAAKYKRSEVRSGDLVMSIRATVGTVAVVPAELDGANLTQGTARIAPGPLVEQSFLLAQLRAPGMQQWFTQNVKGATFKEITLGTLRTAPIMLPPLELQQKFSAIAKRLSALSDRQQQAEVTANHLFSSLVDRAFRGELTAPSTSKKKQLDMFEGLGGE